jgi:hypothetical protein
MHLFIQGTALVIEAWHLVLTAVGIMVTTLLAMWNINRAKQKDLDERFNLKADKSIIKKELQIIDVRVGKVEDMSQLQDKYLKDTMDEQHAILDVMQADIKDILKRLK